MKKAILFMTMLFLTLSLFACANGDVDSEQENDEIEEKEDVEEEENMDKYENLKELPYYDYLNENNPVVIIVVKDFGTMELELFSKVAEISVENFIKYIETESYKNSSFHRIIEDFMIQGGIVDKTFPPIKGEFDSNGIENDLKHYRGVISMARTMFPDSATSQFFIVHKTSPHLDKQYAGFGGLISGFDVLDKIAKVKTNLYDAPLKEVVIENITIKK